MPFTFNFTFDKDDVSGSQEKKQVVYSHPDSNVTNIMPLEVPVVSTCSCKGELESLTQRISMLENTIITMSFAQMQPKEPESISSLVGLDVRRRENSIGSLSATLKNDPTQLFKELTVSATVPESEGEECMKLFPTFNHSYPEATAIDIADSSQEEAMEVEEEEEEEEEDAMELEEFVYKGVTYYKDSENQVYQTDTDGDLDDTPIGVWNDLKQKVLKFAAK